MAVFAQSGHMASAKGAIGSVVKDPCSSELARPRNLMIWRRRSYLHSSIHAPVVVRHLATGQAEMSLLGFGCVEALPGPQDLLPLGRSAAVVHGALHGEPDQTAYKG